MTVRSDFTKMEEFKARATAATAKALTVVAIRAQGRMREKMTLTTDRQPSKPGQPPAVQTGRLRNSVTHQAAQPATLLARAGTNLRYGFWLEFGTTKMKESRPWVRPVLSEFSTGKRAVRIFQTAFKASLGVK
jgi:hypothetical protein